jgi:hypothetical protein
MLSPNPTWQIQLPKQQLSHAENQDETKDKK